MKKDNRPIPSVDEQLKKLNSMKDNEIDYSDTPELDENFFKTAELFHRPKKQAITIRYDQDVIEFFKHQGKGWQTKMNAVLKTYVKAHK
jgi:uncharacterized protein (DUF4415 family)